MRSRIPSVSNKRRWATFLYPWRIPLFERLNKNLLFNDVIKNNFCHATEFSDRYQLYDFLNTRFIAGGPTRYLEFGVWEGASIRKWCQLNAHPASRFYGFDSFEGLPEPFTKYALKGAFQLAGKPPTIEDCRVQFIKGLFQQTLQRFLEGFEKDGRLVIHIDCDLYSSTLFCLTSLDKLLRPGSIIIFDEFRDLEHEFAAFWDYTRSFYKKWEGVAFTTFYTQVGILIK
jgi:O-methyltransferase